MEESGSRENGRSKSDMYKPANTQWLMEQPRSIKHIMGIMAERDAAIQARNMAINEKNKACEERDLAIMQRDKAIQEREEATTELDNALAALHFRQNSCPSGCKISRGVKHFHRPQQHMLQSPLRSEASHHPVHSEPPSDVKSRKIERAKDPVAMSPSKRTPNSGRETKMEGGEEKGRKDSDVGLNVVYDNSTMRPPVCSCTGIYRNCYKWGNGGWQSSCCTMTLSMHPLPPMPNKKRGRVGGRKMSGSVYIRLVSRVAGEGHDVSTPVDLKEHWAKHGTSRYITIK